MVTDEQQKIIIAFLRHIQISPHVDWFCGIQETAYTIEKKLLGKPFNEEVWAKRRVEIVIERGLINRRIIDGGKQNGKRTARRRTERESCKRQGQR